MGLHPRSLALVATIVVSACAAKRQAPGGTHEGSEPRWVRTWGGTDDDRVSDLAVLEVYATPSQIAADDRGMWWPATTTLPFEEARNPASFERRMRGSRASG